MAEMTFNNWVNIINQVKGKDQIKEENKLLNELKNQQTDVNEVTKKGAKENRDNAKEKNNNYREGNRLLMGNLGLMFAGMALNKQMASLTGTAKEWTGISEIWSDAMGVVMLPATLDFMEKGVLPLSEALMNLPEEVQLVLGYTVLGLEGVGKGLEWTGQIALAASAFKIAFPALASKIVAGITAALPAVGAITLGASVFLTYKSITTEGGESLIYGLGAGIASGLGTTLLGASAATGIAIGAITIAGILAWKFASNMAEQAKAYRALGEDVFQNEVQGALGQEGQMTRVTTPIIDEELKNAMSNLSIDLEEVASTFSTSEYMEVNINQDTNVEVADLAQFEVLIDSKMQDMVDEIRSVK